MSVRIFQATYKDQDGKKQTARRWYMDIWDHNRIRHRVPGLESKRQTEALGRRIDDLISTKASGLTPSADCQRWIDSLPKRLLEQLVSWGVLEGARVAVGQVLREHLADFGRSLGDTEHARQTETALLAAFDACGFVTWADVSGSKFQQYLQNRLTDKESPISQRTYNWTLGSAKHFGRWMIRDGRTGSSPLEHLARLKVTDAQKRRAFTIPEMRLLLTTTWHSGPMCGLPGPVRSVCYRLGCETGLRLSELLSLSAGSFNFADGTVTVKASATKNRREATLPLTTTTAALLRDLTRSMLPETKVFPVRGGVPALSAGFKDDLERAGIDATDNGSGSLCFHCLRHTTATMLAAAGVPVKVAMDFMRHSDVNLTLARYSHTVRAQLVEAAGTLPDFQILDQSQVKTGTDGGSVGGQGNFSSASYLATSLATNGTVCRNSLEFPGEMGTGQDRQKTAVVTQNRGSLSRNEDRQETGELGVGPRLTDPESVVLPLHYSPVDLWTNTDKYNCCLPALSTKICPLCSLSGPGKTRQQSPPLG